MAERGSDFGNEDDIRYQWNQKHQIWDLFSEAGEWLGFSAAPRPPPSRLEAFEDAFMAQFVDFSQCSDYVPELDLAEAPSPRSQLGRGVEAQGQEDEYPNGVEAGTPSFSNPFGSEASLHEPPSPSEIQFEDMAVNRGVLDKIVNGHKNGEMTPRDRSPAYFMDSSSPLRPDNETQSDTLEKSSRNISRRSHGPQRNSPKRGWSLGESANESAKFPKSYEREDISAARSTHGNTNIDPILLDESPSLATQDRAHGARSSSIVVDEHQISANELWNQYIDSPNPLFPHPDLSAVNLSDFDFDDLSPGEAFHLTAADLQRFSIPTCRSIADAMRSQREANCRRAIWTSMFAGYVEWRTDGGLATWRAARAEITDADLTQQEFTEECIVNGLEFTLVLEEPETLEGAMDLPSPPPREESPEVAPPLDAPAVGYTDWERRWFDISVG